jgi:hypothetical protein
MTSVQNSAAQGKVDGLQMVKLPGIPSVGKPIILEGMVCDLLSHL